MVNDIDIGFKRKRVGALYRVSTKGQLDGNDIPMQERACKSMIEKMEGWVLTKEYVERGVSGFKVSAANRDVIQQAKDDAENGLIDVLLVFMFDRLGRKDDETPFVLEWFVSHGIEMWSVIEGQQKIEAHTDRLVNYLRFWQSSGESRKTSERVNEKHTQMVEDGVFRGGGIPYGYKTVETDRKNKKGKTLLKMVVDENESAIIKEIYKLAYEEGFGQLRIAKLLNERNVPTRKAKKWGAATVNVILKNPIYKGVMRYRNDHKEIYSDIIPELIIISESIWDAIQTSREKRNPKTANQDNNILMSTKGSLLFIGMARCGVCNSKLTSTTFTNKYRNAEGEIIKYNSSKSYRCSGKLQGKTICNGQGTFSANKTESMIIDTVYMFLEILQKKNLSKEIETIRLKKAGVDEKKINSHQAKLEEMNKELSILMAEVPKSIVGKSSFSPDLLNSLINTKNNEISTMAADISKLQEIVNSKKVEMNEYHKLSNHIPNWQTIFENSSNEKKRVMLNILIDHVKVFKGKIQIKWNKTVEEFLGLADELT